MAGFVTVGASDEVDEGKVATFTFEGAKIAIARVEGRLYAFDDVCTHMGCPLSTGELEGASIECECHGSVFSVVTGAVEAPPATDPIETYPVREDGGRIQLEIP